MKKIFFPCRSESEYRYRCPWNWQGRYIFQRRERSSFSILKFSRCCFAEYGRHRDKHDAQQRHFGRSREKCVFDEKWRMHGMSRFHQKALFHILPGIFFASSFLSCPCFFVKNVQKVNFVWFLKWKFYGILHSYKLFWLQICFLF